MLSLRQGSWKYVSPGDGPKKNAETNTGLGNDPAGQLYDLASDPGETGNLAAANPERAKAMSALLDRIREGGRSRTNQEEACVRARES